MISCAGMSLADGAFFSSPNANPPAPSERQPRRVATAATSVGAHPMSVAAAAGAMDAYAFSMHAAISSRTVDASEAMNGAYSGPGRVSGVEADARIFP